MKCYTAATLLLALGITARVEASPVAPICKVVRFGLALDPKAAPRATTYCSSLLRISPKTTSIVQITTTSTTIQETTTAPSAVTVTEAAVTSTDTITETSTNVETDTVTETITAVTSTLTTTVTSGTVFTTTNVCVTVAGGRRRDAQLEDRALRRPKPAPRPAAWNNYASSLVSRACFCLSLTTQTVTAQRQSTATSTFTQISTVTSTTTTTPIVYATVTAVTYFTSTVTSTAMSVTYPTMTSTIVVQSTSSVSNNLCNAAATRGRSVFYFSDAVAFATGELPEIQLQSAKDRETENGWFTMVQQAGRIYAVKRESSDNDTQEWPAGDIVMYVKDGLLGGPVYFGSTQHVASNGYFMPPCTFQRYFNFYKAVCYNSAGAPFSPALLDQGRGKLLMYTGSNASGALDTELYFADTF